MPLSVYAHWCFKGRHLSSGSVSHAGRGCDSLISRCQSPEGCHLSMQCASKRACKEQFQHKESGAGLNPPAAIGQCRAASRCFGSPLGSCSTVRCPYNMPRTCSPAYIRSVGTLAHVLHQTTSCEAALWTSTQHLDLYERLQSPARLLKALMDALVNDLLPSGRLH